jgi:hypothetical protein
MEGAPALVNCCFDKKTVPCLLLLLVRTSCVVVDVDVVVPGILRVNMKKYHYSTLDINVTFFAHTYIHILSQHICLFSMVITSSHKLD